MIIEYIVCDVSMFVSVLFCFKNSNNKNKTNKRQATCTSALLVPYIKIMVRKIEYLQQFRGCG